MSMYDKMLQLPIFMGLSNNQLTAIIEKIPFSFERFNAGDVILEAGRQCDSVTFILNGDVRLVTPTFAGRMFIAQDFSGPHTMPFYYMFGAETRHFSELRAVTQAGVMQVEKMRFMEMLQLNDIMLLNVMNMLSTHAQKQHLAMDFSGESDPVLRLSSWMLAFTDRTATNILIEAREPDWCDMLQLSPSDFWRCVSMLENRGCLEVSEGKLKLTDRYALRRFVGEKSGQRN
ncbi:MAG: Crp/Fnr family transcriptional regulator [Bacteroidales bacterium]|nr:Crp/Fnr family transcriptional regulator [Candidatus Liminaster caballi]